MLISRGKFAGGNTISRHMTRKIQNYGVCLAHLGKQPRKLYPHDVTLKFKITPHLGLLKFGENVIHKKLPFWRSFGQGAFIIIPGYQTVADFHMLE